MKTQTQHNDLSKGGSEHHRVTTIMKLIQQKKNSFSNIALR